MKYQVATIIEGLEGLETSLVEREEKRTAEVESERQGNVPELLKYAELIHERSDELITELHNGADPTKTRPLVDLISEHARWGLDNVKPRHVRGEEYVDRNAFGRGSTIRPAEPSTLEKVRAVLTVLRGLTEETISTTELRTLGVTNVLRLHSPY